MAEKIGSKGGETGPGGGWRTDKLRGVHQDGEKGCRRSDSNGTERAKIGERRSGNANGGRSGEKKRKSTMKWKWRNWDQGVANVKVKEWGRKRNVEWRPEWEKGGGAKRTRG